MRLSVRRGVGGAAPGRRLELAKRKGAGHPDALCDALAGAAALDLARFHQDHFGETLPQSISVLVIPGAATPRFGGGTLAAPLHIHLTGWTARTHRGIRVPVEDLVAGACRRWLRTHLHGLDPDRQIRLRIGLEDLASAASVAGTGQAIPWGFGYTPLSRLEALVARVEGRLNSSSVKAKYPAIGEDILVAGVGRGSRARLQVRCALMDRYLPNPAAYRACRDQVLHLAQETAVDSGLGARFVVNPEEGDGAAARYLTTSGTFAERTPAVSGNGNGANGLISARRPGRPLPGSPLELNRLHEVAAGVLAQAALRAVPELAAVECLLVGAPGRSPADPERVALDVRVPTGLKPGALKPRLELSVREALDGLETLVADLLAGDLVTDGWPYDRTDPDPLVPEEDWSDARATMLEAVAARARETAGWTGRPVLAPPVLAALARVPRHRFLPRGHRALAYGDGPVALGRGQTLSAPFIVALMSDLARVDGGSKVLEVGTGSGYQAAVLAELGARVCSVEVIPALARAARDRLDALGYQRIRCRQGDGSPGWPEEAPFDAILVTAAAPTVPRALLEQLAPGGRLVLPLAAPGGDQELCLIQRGRDGRLHERRVLPVSFVPLAQLAESQL